jgi:predicted HTH transcriptional regulator
MTAKFKRATDYISPDIFKNRGESLKYLKPFGKGPNLPSLHCCDHVDMSQEFVHQILRIMAALANTKGGAILCPATLEKEPLDLALNGISRKSLDSFKQKLNSELERNINPRLDVKMWTIRIEDEVDCNVLAIIIPASRACPHMLIGDNENAIYLYKQATPIRADISGIEQLFQRKLARKTQVPISPDNSPHVVLTDEELKMLLS